MDMIRSLLAAVFGGGRNVITETVEAFRPNAEAEAARSADYQAAALAQMAAEFSGQRRTWFDALIDGLNRIPRPAMAIGTIALIVMAMVDPVWFGERMAGLALVPEPLWWLMGAIVTFYFGARAQAKTQDFQRSVAETVARVPQVVSSIAQLRQLRADSPGAAETGENAALTLAVTTPSDNAALSAWRST